MRLCGLVAGIFFLGTSGAQADYETLPTGYFPSLDQVVGADRPVGSLGTEVEDLGQRVKDTVKKVAARRNTTCFNDPCQVQAFPMVYTLPLTGFYAGARVNITNLKRRSPPRNSVDLTILRSDQGEFTHDFGIDFPRIDQWPRKPRLKLRVSDTRTSDIRYMGMGLQSVDVQKRPDAELRYFLRETTVSGTIRIPLLKIDDEEMSVFSSVRRMAHAPNVFERSSQTYLSEENPVGFQLGRRGGQDLVWSVGFFFDARDDEKLARSGYASEISFEKTLSAASDYKFSRLTIVDRRYLSWGRAWTLANRLTADALIGDARDVPFWQFAGVGGYEPASDVATDIVRGFPPGRFHERLKLIESAELRWFAPDFRFLNIGVDPVWVPLAFDLGQFGKVFAYSVGVGGHIWLNRRLLVHVSFNWAENFGLAGTMSFQAPF